ncbi:Sugar transporter SWEET [Aphelenchoides bicaudatus]|nr:Sugar transporter SWEET [Aphelenchoides bicaudatus]
MEYESSLLHVLSISATVSTFCLFLCGLEICNRIRQRGTTDGTSVAPFAITIISCIFWLGYGDLRNDSTIIFVNGVGLIVQGFYFAYYYRLTRSKSWLNKLISFMILCSVFTYWFVRESGFSLENRETVLGLICMILNVLSISAPLMDVGQVIRARMLNGWFMDSLTDDFYMKVPNTIAVLISAVQLSLFAIYPSHRVVVHERLPDHLL